MEECRQGERALAYTHLSYSPIGEKSPLGARAGSRATLCFSEVPVLHPGHYLGVGRNREAFSFLMPKEILSRDGEKGKSGR